MTAHRLVAELLVAAGVLICVASSVGAVLPRRVLGRIHFVTPMTAIGAPLIGIGLAVDIGWQLATALILFIVLVLAATGPVLAAATARVAAERQNLVPMESPE